VEKQFYLIAMFACRATAAGAANPFEPALGTLYAVSGEEFARELGLAFLREKCPESEGWGPYMISVAAVGVETLRSAVAELAEEGGAGGEGDGEGGDPPETVM
jgi:hypothetical protein